MSACKLLYVFTKAPYSNAAGQEALDAALIGASFDQDCSLLFLHDGVFQLIKNQNASGTDLKQYTKTFSAMSDFGIDDIYVDELSLLARGITDDQLMTNVSSLDSAAVRELISSQYRVLTF